MKYYKQFLSVLLVFVLLFGVFSTTVSAEENIRYKVSTIMKWYQDGSVAWELESPHNVNVSDDNINIDPPSHFSQQKLNSNSYFLGNIIITRSDNALLVKKGDSFKIDISNLTYQYSYSTSSTNSGYLDFKKMDFIEFIGVTTSGGYKYDEANISYAFSQNSNTGSVTGNLTAEEDYQKFIIRFKYCPTVRVGVTGTYNLGYYAENFKNPSLKVTISTEEAGLLKSIINWLQSIGQSIYELPQKLWYLIADGLKTLFVPDPNYFQQYRMNWGGLLSTRLGAVFESVSFVSVLANNLLTAGQVDIIELPIATINLPGGNTFSFGGMNIDIVPDKFVFIVTTLKIIIGIVATLGFVNGMAKRYDEVMGVEK